MDFRMDYMQVAQLIRSSIANINRFIDSRWVEYRIGSSQWVEYRIGSSQIEYLLYIRMNPGVNQMELSRIRNAGKPGVTKALGILEKNGLITRRRDPEDRRNRRCFLTEKGANSSEEFQGLAAGIGGVLFKEFTKEEREEFIDYLHRFYAATLGLARDQRVNHE